jgi:glycosyltransferase involved in cell wall biosynthesis
VSLVSVIIPAHRAEPFVSRAVQSVVRQTCPQWEVLVVSDDGMDYAAVVGRAGVHDRRLRFVATPRPSSGPGAARNLGLGRASGDLVAPLDADDLFYPERLARLVPLAQAHGMAGDNVRVVREADGLALGTALDEGAGLTWLDLDGYAETSVPMTFVFRRDVIRGSWDEGVELAEDTLFNLRVIEALGRVPVLETPLHEYRVRDESLCHGPDAVARAERAYAAALEALGLGGLGLRTEAARRRVRAMLTRKRALNRAFGESLAAGRRWSYQEFIAAGGASAAGG